jgi:uncharacterized repeat protein (TIGR01451 family)
MRHPPFVLAMALIASLTPALVGITPTALADAASTSFRPNGATLANKGDSVIVTVETVGVDTGVDTFQINIQHPDTLDISDPTCIGIFSGGLSFPLTGNIPGIGNLTGCTRTDGATGTTGDVMTFRITRVGDFTEPQVVRFGVGTDCGGDVDDNELGTQFFKAGVPVCPGVTNTFTVEPFLAASIDIQKEPESQQVRSGDDVTFTITVENTGDVPLTDVEVSDEQCHTLDFVGGDENGNDILDPGETWTYTCTVEDVIEDFTNTVMATGDPPEGEEVSDTDSAEVDVILPKVDIDKLPGVLQVRSGDDATFTIKVINEGDVALTNIRVTDELCDPPTLIDQGNGDDVLDIGETWTYTCIIENVTEDLVNVAQVTATPPVGEDVFDSEQAIVDVISPAIDVEKTPDNQTVVIGGVATFNITVKNTGDAPLTNVRVTDAMAPDCDLVIDELPIGATSEYICIVENLTGDFTNVVIATGTPPVGEDVSDTDSAEVKALNVAIDVEKETETPTVTTGSDVTFTITVENTGDVPLTEIEVSDELCDTLTLVSGDENGNDILDTGETWTYTCVVEDVTEDFTNVATATGVTAEDDEASDSDAAEVNVIGVAEIDVEKAPETQQVRSGGTATFTITVKNNGEVTLADVTVTDPLAPDCDGFFESLEPGEAESYTCTITDVTEDFTNEVTATGKPLEGAAVSDTDSAEVEVVHPAIEVEKIVEPPVVPSGGSVTFTVNVVNTGDTPLTNVVVTDSRCTLTFVGGDENGNSVLDPAETWTYTCVIEGVTEDFSNGATATATPPVGDDVTDTDSATVDVINPGINVEKKPEFQQVVSGGTATFTIEVTNTGDVVLTNVVVTDSHCTPIFVGGDDGDGVFEPGETWIYTCVVEGITDDFTNTAKAMGATPLGAEISHSDSAEVEVMRPAIDIEKSPEAQQVRSGRNAMFTITVKNTGNVPLTNVAVTDEAAPDCARVVGNLAPGQSVEYTCSLKDVTGDFTNSATATGTPPVGDDVSDTDKASVDVINPAIAVEKSPETQQARNGDDVTFTIAVTNTGDVVLTNVVVTDSHCTPIFVGGDDGDGVFEPGETWTYTCTVEGVTRDFTNTAKATGMPPVGRKVKATDTATVDVINPAIDIRKTPRSQQAATGFDVVFTITVRNIGDVDLTNVVVTDPMAPACDRVIGNLAVGARDRYTCVVRAVVEDFVNTATATGTPPLGGDVSDTDSASVSLGVKVVTITSEGEAAAGDQYFVVVAAPDDTTVKVNGEIATPIDEVPELLRRMYGLNAVGSSNATHVMLASVDHGAPLGPMPIEIRIGNTRLTAHLEVVAERTNRNYYLFPGLNYNGLGLAPHDPSLDHLLDQETTNASPDFVEALGRGATLRDVIATVFVYSDTGEFLAFNTPDPLASNPPLFSDDIELKPFQGMLIMTREAAFDTDDGQIPPVPIRMNIRGPFLRNDPTAPITKELRFGFNLIAPHARNDSPFEEVFRGALVPRELVLNAIAFKREVAASSVEGGGIVAEVVEKWVLPSPLSGVMVEPELAYWAFVARPEAREDIKPVLTPVE